MVGQCRSGRFDTPDLNAIKMNIQIKERGKGTMLGSWKDVVDKYGEAVAKASLRQGTLPHVPHPFLLPGHGVQWPDSHQFIMEESWWILSWREKLNFESAGEQEATQAQIDLWLRAKDPFYKMEDNPNLEAIRDGASTGIPENVAMAPVAPAPTAASISSEPERRVNPEFCGPDYDKLHGEVMNNLPGAIASWQKTKQKSEVEIAKAEHNTFAAPVTKAAKEQIKATEKKAKYLETVVQTYLVRGRGHYSKPRPRKNNSDVRRNLQGGKGHHRKNECTRIIG